MNILDLGTNKIGLIFDFNGTLFWDSDKHELAWRIFIKELCNRDISDSEFLQYVHGRNNDFILGYFLETSLSVDVIDDLSEEKEIIYRKLCIEDTVNFQLAPGAIRLLDNLKRCNIPRAIATASTKVNVDFYRKEFQLNKWFDDDKIIYNDGTIKGKPNPDIYIKAAKMIQVDVQNCVVIEDAISGIQSAYKAGIGKIIAISPKDRQAIFEDVKEVDCIINDFNEVECEVENAKDR